MSGLGMQKRHSVVAFLRVAEFLVATDTRIFNPLLYQLSYQAKRGTIIAIDFQLRKSSCARGSTNVVCASLSG
jgi:hypothetical protein